MNFIETILGWLFGVVTFFDNLKSRRGDDPGTARYRSLKRACVLTMLLPFAVLGLGYLVANRLDAFGALMRNPHAFGDLRSTLAGGFLGFLRHLPWWLATTIGACGGLSAVTTTSPDLKEGPCV